MFGLDQLATSLVITALVIGTGVIAHFMSLRAAKTSSATADDAPDIAAPE